MRTVTAYAMSLRLQVARTLRLATTMRLRRTTTAVVRNWTSAVYAAVQVSLREMRLRREYVLDECGVCGGSGIPEGACDCDGNTAADGYDCDGNCLADADGDGVCDEFEVAG